MRATGINRGHAASPMVVGSATHISAPVPDFDCALERTESPGGDDADAQGSSDFVHADGLTLVDSRTGGTQSPHVRFSADGRRLGAPPDGATTSEFDVRNRQPVRARAVFVDSADAKPQKPTLDAVARGDAELAVFCGRTAGIFSQSRTPPLQVAPVSPWPDASEPIVFDIATGVLRETALPREEEAAPDRNAAQSRASSTITRYRSCRWTLRRRPQMPPHRAKYAETRKNSRETTETTCKQAAVAR
ncbi:hypothetical protein [Cognatilysobacter lacus]|uniref:Uncharacterized protein n=1 Tax=Cognatilysobacter lacus TaxID=1643323 RepID=A0A5D8Z4T9_9GAMM|nr:hypothetical protein [Lysobacter lacus]TZF89759.1 hypothetical protein FW784_08050 [Lysobacter lacus]